MDTWLKCLWHSGRKVVRHWQLSPFCSMNRLQLASQHCSLPSSSPAAGRPVPVLLTALRLSSLRVGCRTRCAVLALPALVPEFWAAGTVWFASSIHPDCFCRIQFPTCSATPLAGSRSYRLLVPYWLQWTFQPNMTNSESHFKWCDQKSNYVAAVGKERTFLLVILQKKTKAK